MPESLGNGLTRSTDVHSQVDLGGARTQVYRVGPVTAKLCLFQALCACATMLFQNPRAAAWFRKGHAFATCPIIQGALVRFHLRAGVGATAESARLLLESISSLPRHQFWPDDASYLELPTAGIIGHRQVTDAYLVLLARKHGGSLATMDQGLAAVHAGTTLLASI